MKFTIPDQLPLREDFLLTFLRAIFPEEKTVSGNAYSKDCQRAATELGLYDVKLKEDSHLFRLMYEIGIQNKRIFGKDSSMTMIESRQYASYGDNIFTFCDPSNGSLRRWVGSGSKPRSKINGAYDAAVFFTYLLLEYAAPEARRDVFASCLNSVGISDLQGAEAERLFRFDWDELGEEGVIPPCGSAKETHFQRLNNPAIILLGATALTIFELLGTYPHPNRDDPERIRELHSLIDRTLREEQAASEALDCAERTLYRQNRIFEPRSITIRRQPYPQDIFVMPVLKRVGDSEGEAVRPFARLREMEQSCRAMIVAKTGMGKSALMQMATVCMLQPRFGETESASGKLEAIAEQLNPPEDLFVISVPARMFSDCYGNLRYKAWTDDFVKLFLNCMWKLGGINFFKKAEENGQNPAQPDYEFTDALRGYLQEMARRGKLLLILDSFDEISSGEMREAYLRAISVFRDQYCCFHETGEVGAHVILCTREMSPETMDELKMRLDIRDESVFDIRPLNDRQRRKIVMNWNRFSNDRTTEEAEEILREIENNHFYRDYSVNPYMLSVVYFNFEHKLSDVSQRFISYLVNRMLSHNNNADFAIREVLGNIVKILQEIARETVTNGRAHFSRWKLDTYLSSHIDKRDLSEREVRANIDRLHKIFVTEVGLIVPADGADSDYQFLNNQIRYELAAKGIQQLLEDHEHTESFREELLPAVHSVREYVGFLIPLLCVINLENVQLAELLVSDLAMHDFEDDDEERLLLEAMLDLLLNRYGSSIVTSSSPGVREKRYVRRAQRALLMRVLTSRNFAPTEQEREALLASSAWQSNQDWISDFLVERMRKPFFP